MAIVAHDRSFGIEGRGKIEVCRVKQISRLENGGGIEEWVRRSNLYEPKLCRNRNGFSEIVAELHAFGNAVVPQQFYPIFKAIADQMEVT
jgi:DNA (cytosine-5)-methyltransferase 1